MVHYNTILQNATDLITKRVSYFITKYSKRLLQNALGFLLKNATILLQNATAITKSNVYYKMRQYRIFLTRDISGASLPWAETIESPVIEVGLKAYLFYKIVNALSPHYCVNYLNLNNSSTFLTRAPKQNKKRNPYENGAF